MAAPVFEEKGPVTAALHVHGPAYRFPSLGDAECIGEAVADTSRRLSAALARWTLGPIRFLVLVICRGFDLSG